MNELLGRTLVIVAHADDEAVACGALLQRMRNAFVVICTDGAPRGEYFWKAYGSRKEYARVRAGEARRALQAVGVREFDMLPLSVADDLFVDQELFRQISQAMHALMDIASHMQPDAVLTLAYEGGHPDHDTCNFLGRQVSKVLNVPVWEAPLYHRAGSNDIVVQRFIHTLGEEVAVELTHEELARKQTMQAAYASQRDVLATFDAGREIVRPMIHYDYSRPPHEGTLNYEAWGWPMRGWELCDHFMQYLNAAPETLSYPKHKRIA